MKDHHTEFLVKPAKRLLKVLLKAEKAMPSPSEHDEQVALFLWAELNRRKYPVLKLLFHVPNGGHRHIAIARKLKAEGVKAGVPDIFLPVSRFLYHGLFIEMKKKKGGVISPSQTEWIENLKKQGYSCDVAYGFEDAKKIIEDYLK